MIDDTTKDKLIREIAKSGNVYLSCLKINVDKSTYYRWLQSDKEFSKLARQATRHGRENNCDIARHALMLRVKEKDLGAIKYVLGHMDPTFKMKKNSSVVILHKKDTPHSLTDTPKTFEDLITDYETNGEQRAMDLRARLIEFGKEIPKKPDGTPIELNELLQYEAYIRNWQELKEKEKQEELHKKYVEPGTTVLG